MEKFHTTQAIRATPEKILTLENGLAIYKAGLVYLREPDVNARYMPEPVFENLTNNLKKDKRLESLPLCCFNENYEQNKELKIISGTHRIKAARSAGLEMVYVLVIEEKLEKSKFIAKQLSHNSLTGVDDEQVLAHLFKEIEDCENKLYAGLNIEQQFNIQKENLEEIICPPDFYNVTIFFAKSDKEKFDDCIKTMLDSNEVIIEDIKCFNEFKKAILNARKSENIRSLSPLIGKMASIINEYYASRKTDKPDKAK